VDLAKVAAKALTIEAATAKVTLDAFNSERVILLSRLEEIGKHGIDKSAKDVGIVNAKIADVDTRSHLHTRAPRIQTSVSLRTNAREHTNAHAALGAFVYVCMWMCVCVCVCVCVCLCVCV